MISNHKKRKAREGYKKSNNKQPWTNKPKSHRDTIRLKWSFPASAMTLSMEEGKKKK